MPTAAGVDVAAGGYAIDVHAASSASASAAITCGDIAVKTPKSSAKAFLKGAAGERGHAELVQKGSDVTGWVKLTGLTPGAHAVQLHVGSCAAPGAVAVSLGDVTAGPYGTVLAEGRRHLEHPGGRQGLLARRACRRERGPRRDGRLRRPLEHALALEEVGGRCRRQAPADRECDGRGCRARARPPRLTPSPA